MLITGCLLSLLGFLAIAVGAQAQGCSTPPCVSSFTIAPNVIPGDGTTTAIATVTLNLGQSNNQSNDVSIYGPTLGYRCLPPAFYDGGTSCSPSDCQLPKGVNTLQFELWGSNT